MQFTTKLQERSRDHFYVSLLGDVTVAVCGQTLNCRHKFNGIEGPILFKIELPERKILGCYAGPKFADCGCYTAPNLLC